MKQNDRGPLTKLFQQLLDAGYPSGKKNCAQPTLPGVTADDEFGGEWIVDRIYETVGQIESHQAKFHHALAELVDRLVKVAHRTNCTDARTPSADGHGCDSELPLCDTVLSYLARRFNYRLDRTDTMNHLKELISSPLTGDDRALRGALYSALVQDVRPHWIIRPRHNLMTGTPVVQIATPITHVSSFQYKANRHITTQIRLAIERAGMTPEAPTDYIDDINRHTAPENEFHTRGALLQTSAVVILADGGAIGTGITWAITEEYGIPSLVLHSAETSIDAIRFPGLGSHTVRQFQTPSDALQAVQDFLDLLSFTTW